MMSRAKNWCFTLNNYTQGDVDRLMGLGDQVQYLVFGREVGESGTRHLQGLVCFPSRKRMNQVKEVIGQCHLSVTRYLEQSDEYCKKDGNFESIGSLPQRSNQGQRNDLELFKEDVKQGNLDLKSIRELHSEVYAKYPRFCIEYVNDNQTGGKVANHPLRDWQSELNTKLNGPVDEREIIFVVDAQGNKGKSWFFRYYEQNHEDNCQIILPGKKLDMAHVLHPGKRVYLFDCPRSKQGEFIQYDFLEEVKNGNVFSGKYESKNKRFDVPHVVVAMNEMPDMEKLSSDRYNIINLQ